MRITVIGFNHKTCPIDIREKLAFKDKDIECALRGINALPEIRETVILSTCNRVEIYFVRSASIDSDDDLLEFIAKYHRVEVTSFKNLLYRHTNSDAIEHLFRVISSLDSLAVGEPQIHGQVKDAYQKSRELHTSGKIMNTLFEKALYVGKRVRTETGIGRAPISVSSVAVDLAEKIFGDLKGKQALVIGAGEMGELVAQNLVDAGISKMVVANRSIERAEEVAKKFNAESKELFELPSILSKVDMIVVSVSASEPLLNKEMIVNALKIRRGNPIFIIDISVPRNVEEEINSIDNVYLYNTDDLTNVANKNKMMRSSEVAQCEEIIKYELEKYLDYLISFDTVPIIQEMREKFEEIRLKEIERVILTKNILNEEQMEAVDYLTRSIMNKLLHNPMVILKKDSGTEEGFNERRSLEKLFCLKEEEK